MYTKHEKVYVKGDNSNAFTIFDDTVMKNKDLTPVDKLIQVYLKSNDTNEWWYSYPVIAKDLNIGESTVKRSIERLKKLGYVMVAKQQKNNKGKFDKVIYYVTDIPFEFVNENGEIIYSDDNEPYGQFD